MTLSAILVAIVAGFVLLVVGTRLLVWSKARAWRGKAVPRLSGQLGARIQASRRGLVYFFTPSCAACRVWTPRVRELSQKSEHIYLVDAMEQRSLAQAFGIMATPTTVEIEDGKVVQLHIGGIPASVLAKFGQA